MVDILYHVRLSHLWATPIVYLNIDLLDAYALSFVIHLLAARRSNDFRLVVEAYLDCLGQDEGVSESVAAVSCPPPDVVSAPD